MLTDKNQKLQKELEKIAAKYKVQAEKEQALYIKSYASIQAREDLLTTQKKEIADLEKKHKEEADDFKKTFGVELNLTKTGKTKFNLTTDEKCKLVTIMEDSDGNKKYRIFREGNIYSVWNSKNEEVTSTLVFKDNAGAKQTLSVKALKDYADKKMKIAESPQPSKGNQ